MVDGEQGRDPSPLRPWDRQPGESDEAFLWWQAFRDARPPRRLDRLRLSVPGKVAPTLEQLMEWYRATSWHTRAEAWDIHLDSIQQESKERVAAEMASREMMLVSEIQELAARELGKFLQTSLESTTEVLRPGELTRLLEHAVKLGRLVRGETTESVSVKPALDTDALSVEELLDFRRLMEKARGGNRDSEG